MFLDILLLILLVLATYTGYKRGLIVGVFFTRGYYSWLSGCHEIIRGSNGLFACLFFLGRKWVPPLSFLLVLVGVILLIRLGANALEKGVQLITLGWVNTLGGILFYWAIYLLSCSIILFYALQLPFFPTDGMEESITYLI